MVKELLREQQDLKEQLNGQHPSKSQRPPAGPAARKGPQGSLNKKSSERVPRQQPRDYHLRGPPSRDKKANPREALNVPLQVKPGEGDPKSNLKQVLSRQTHLERRRKEQQEKEKSKLDAIEAKIENARKRLEEKKKLKSQNAKNALKAKKGPGHNYRHNESNQDLDDVDDLYVEPKPRNRVQANSVNRFKGSSHSQAAVSEANARSMKALSHKMGSPGKQYQMAGNHESQQFNLDNEGTSQFTYPAQ